MRPVSVDVFLFWKSYGGESPSCKAFRPQNSRASFRIQCFQPPRRHTKKELAMSCHVIFCKSMARLALEAPSFHETGSSSSGYLGVYLRALRPAARAPGGQGKCSAGEPGEDTPRPSTRTTAPKSNLPSGQPGGCGFARRASEGNRSSCQVLSGQEGDEEYVEELVVFSQGISGPVLL